LPQGIDILKHIHGVIGLSVFAFDKDSVLPQSLLLLCQLCPERVDLRNPDLGFRIPNLGFC
jgi:hypothetical protein